MLTVSHWGFDGGRHTGRLVVLETANPLRMVFRRLYAARFPVRTIVPVDAYHGSDFRSIEADNTSAFNCRRATGSGSWSEHALVRAYDEIGWGWGGRWRGSVNDYQHFSASGR